MLLLLLSYLGVEEGAKYSRLLRGRRSQVLSSALPPVLCRLRVFDSGVMVIELQSHKEEEMVASALETVREPSFLQAPGRGRGTGALPGSWRTGFPFGLNFPHN